MHRGFAKDPDGLAALVPIDVATGRIFRRPIDARALQGGGRDPCRVPVLAPKVSGPPARRLVEVLASGKSSVWPEIVVPTGSDHPRVRWEAVRPTFDARERLFEARGSGEVDGEVSIGEAFEVDVRVDQAGPGLACQADDFCAAPCGRAGCVAYREDSAIDAGCDFWLTPGEQRGLDQITGVFTSRKSWR